MRSGTCLSLFLAALAACGRSAAADREPPQLERADVVRYHMQLHFADLRSVERHLVNGRLEEAQALAFLIGQPEKDAGLRPWARELVAAATALSKARTVEDALRAEVRVAVACATCHARALPATVFSPPGRPPLSDHASPAVRLDRHRWATDRLWQGLVGASEDHWRAGLAVLAETPLPSSEIAGAAPLARSMQKRAAQLLREAPPKTVDDRGRMYDRMLVTCTGCHAAVKRGR